MKFIRWIFYVCLLVFLGCEYTLTTTVSTDVASSDAVLSLASENDQLEFHAGISVYLRDNTSADKKALELSAGTSTTLVDPDSNIWKIGTQKGYLAADFATAGYTQDWFPTSEQNGQLFYFQAFAHTPAPVPDPMLDSPAYCSVYLDAGSKQLYAWLYREADIIPCPTPAEYKTWLPRVEASPFSPANSPK